MDEGPIEEEEEEESLYRYEITTSINRNRLLSTRYLCLNCGEFIESSADNYQTVNLQLGASL